MKLKRTIETFSMVSISLLLGLAMILNAKAAGDPGSMPEAGTAQAGTQQTTGRTIEIRFHDTDGIDTVTREYLEPILEEAEADLPGHTSSGNPDTDFKTDSKYVSPQGLGMDSGTIPEDVRFLGWLDCTDVGEDVLEEIYGDSLENNTYLCRDVSKAMPYLIDETALAEEPMELYAAYISLDVETSTNLKESGTEENEIINVPELPVISNTEWDISNAAYTFTITADPGTAALKDNNANNGCYELMYLSCTGPDGWESKIMPDKEGGNVFTVQAEAGKPYKYVAYYSNAASVCHDSGEGTEAAILNYGDKVGEQPVPRFTTEETGDSNAFSGWTAEGPGHQGKQYGLLETYGSVEGTRVIGPEDTVTAYTEMSPLYAPANITVGSNIDHVLGEDAESYRYLEQSGDTEGVTIHAELVIESPAWTETVEHPEESHIEYVEHPEEYHYEQKWIYQCNGCKTKFESYDEVRAHNKEQMLAGNFACGGHSSFMDDVKVVDKEAWTEEVKVVDKEAWTEYIEHEAGEKRYLFTGWERSYGEGTEAEEFSKENITTVSDPSDGAVYTAIYEEGHLVTYHYWEGGSSKPLYSIGIAGGRTFIDPENGEPYDTAAFTKVKATLGAGQAFEGWQLLDTYGDTVPWEEFAPEEITRDMDLYPVISQVKVTDSAGNGLLQDAGGMGMEVFPGLMAAEPSVSVCFADIYPQDRLAVNVSMQSYRTDGVFQGAQGVKVQVYNRYVDGGSGGWTGELAAETVTDTDGTAGFTFAGMLSISAVSVGGAESTFLFEVTRLVEDGADRQTMHLCLKAGEQVALELPYGAYRVTELDGWSWRHTPAYETETYTPAGVNFPEPDNGALVHVNCFGSSVTCTNRETNSMWFSASAGEHDVFRADEQQGK